MEKQIVIVDENNNEVGTAARTDAVQQGLWHRIVVVLVFNSKGEMYIQQRSHNAPSSPGLWDHSAAGHVDAGENPEQAARRELREELGINPDNITFISEYKTQRTVDDKIYNRYWYLFTCTYDGDIHIDEDEVIDGKFVAIEWLNNELVTANEKYTDGIVKSFQVYMDK